MRYEIVRMEVGKLGANCYFIVDTASKEAIIVDPGGSYNEIVEQIEKLAIEVKALVLTHGHCDHIAAAKALKENYNLDVYIHAADKSMLESNEKSLAKALHLGDVQVENSKELICNVPLRFGEIEIKVLHTPGHTPGSVSIVGEGFVLTGDTLFRQSIGRTDFEGGSYSEIEHSITQVLYKLPDHFLVYPGHGGETTIGFEKKNNSFFRG